MEDDIQNHLPTVMFRGTPYRLRIWMKLKLKLETKIFCKTKT